MREAWDGLAETMRRLKDALYDASLECEPGKEHSEDIDAIFDMPNGLEAWEIFELKPKDVATIKD